LKTDEGAKELIIACCTCETAFCFGHMGRKHIMLTKLTKRHFLDVIVTVIGKETK